MASKLFLIFQLIPHVFVVNNNYYISDVDDDDDLALATISPTPSASIK